MPDRKKQFPKDDVGLFTFQPKLEPGKPKPDPMQPPPFAPLKPKSTGQQPAKSGTRGKPGAE